MNKPTPTYDTASALDQVRHDINQYLGQVCSWDTPNTNGTPNYNRCNECPGTYECAPLAFMGHSPQTITALVSHQPEQDSLAQRLLKTPQEDRVQLLHDIAQELHNYDPEIRDDITTTITGIINHAHMNGKSAITRQLIEILFGSAPETGTLAQKKFFNNFIPPHKKNIAEFQTAYLGANPLDQLRYKISMQLGRVCPYDTRDNNGFNWNHCQNCTDTEYACAPRALAQLPKKTQKKLATLNPLLEKSTLNYLALLPEQTARDTLTILATKLQPLDPTIQTVALDVIQHILERAQETRRIEKIPAALEKIFDHVPQTQEQQHQYFTRLY